MKKPIGAIIFALFRFPDPPPAPSDAPTSTAGKIPPAINETNDNLNQPPREGTPTPEKGKQSVARRLSFSLDEDVWQEFMNETVRLNRGRKGSQKALFNTMWELYKAHMAKQTEESQNEGN